jgi:hypothetical protein
LNKRLKDRRKPVSQSDHAMIGASLPAKGS